MVELVNEKIIIHAYLEAFPTVKIKSFFQSLLNCEVF